MYVGELRQLDENEWERFAEDVLFHLGFAIIVGPSVGADEGLDMIADRDETKYLVSCKHNLKSGKSVGVGSEADISDRVKRHGCQAFIAFYSTGPTSALKRKFKDLECQGVKIVELYKSAIMDIMPTMSGFTLQKYFPRPQEITHYINEPIDYKPLRCMEPGCGKDILAVSNMPWSMALLCRCEGELHLVYGCKRCINAIPEIGWVEITQIRYIEQILGFRELIDECIEDGLKPSAGFYKAWALLQEGVVQVLVPPGWGRWLA